MYFKRLEMHGFKSFAEPVVIDFHEGVTCIVGPNGSGKSNISDAIRWVLGEQSPKMLRGGKMEEVIFSGTANRKSRGMAEVTLVIDNSTGILPIDYNEVAITRRMYRSGESEYLINNNHCRLRDIRELIMDTGIGVDGYSLIGQGKISEIVSSKPESRREIFEEAAGVVMYKNKKAEAERKLDGTSANLERVNDIISEIEGRIGGLKKDSEKAVEYLELKERFKELEINITLRNIEKLDETNDSLKNDIKEFSEKIETLNKEKEEIDKKLEADRQRNEHLDQLSSEARDNLLAKVEEINQLTNKSQLNAERLSSIDKDLKRLEEETAEQNEKLVKELKNAESIEAQKKEIAENQEKASQQLSEKIQIHSQLTSQSAELSEDIDNGKNRMFSIHSQVASKRSEAKSIESYKDSLAKRKAQLIEEGVNLENNVKAFVDAMNQALEEKRSADSKLEALKQEIIESTAKRGEVLAQTKNLSKTIEDLRIKNSQIAARKKTIEEMEHNYEGYNGAVRYIMRNVKTGIKGVVADLMSVPQGYEVAIETALGGAMQNIVCNTDEDAKAAIRALKENKAGRCTFLPISSVKSQKGRADERLATMNGYIGIASECIRFDKKYEGIFNYLLGRVVITDNMDNAVKLSKFAGSGLRFVTLDGEIINASGAITGGKYKNATANLLERKQEIHNLEASLRNIEKERMEREDQYSELDEELNYLDNLLDEKNEEYRETELTVVNLETKIQALENSGKNLESGNEKQERELASIEMDYKNADAMILKLMEEANLGETEIKSIEEQIQQNMQAFEELKSKVDAANEEITQTRIEANRWDGKMTSCNQLLHRVKETLEDIYYQIDSRKESMESLEEEKNSLKFGSEDAAVQVELKEKEKADLEGYIEEIKIEREALSESISKMFAQQSGFGEKINGLRDQKYQMELKVGKNDTQLDTLKEKLWEDFEISYLQAIEFRKEDFVMSAATKESRDIKNRIRQLGDVNVGAIKEYKEVSERYEFLTEQRADITTAMNELKTIINDMDRTIREKFKETFDAIVIQFEQIFKQLIGGGNAALRLDDENNPLESGIEIIAQPPGKKLQNINLMSGGEKTMTAIALMFAVLKIKPTPFCILDEVEAALDDANIDRFAKYLRNFENIQFAVVTHQKATMEHADVLYGVTMPEQGISKVLSLRLGDDFEL